MAEIIDELLYLEDIKILITEAIENKGVNVLERDTFFDRGDRVRQINVPQIKPITITRNGTFNGGNKFVYSPVTVDCGKSKVKLSGSITAKASQDIEKGQVVYIDYVGESSEESIQDNFNFDVPVTDSNFVGASFDGRLIYLKDVQMKESPNENLLDKVILYKYDTTPNYVSSNDNEILPDKTYYEKVYDIVDNPAGDPSDNKYYEYNDENGNYILTKDREPLDGKSYYTMSYSEVSSPSGSPKSNKYFELIEWTKERIYEIKLRYDETISHISRVFSYFGNIAIYHVGMTRDGGSKGRTIAGIFIDVDSGEIISEFESDRNYNMSSIFRISDNLVNITENGYIDILNGIYIDDGYKCVNYEMVKYYTTSGGELGKFKPKIYNKQNNTTWSLIKDVGRYVTAFPIDETNNADRIGKVIAYAEKEVKLEEYGLFHVMFNSY